MDDPDDRAIGFENGIQIHLTGTSDLGNETRQYLTISIKGEDRNATRQALTPVPLNLITLPVCGTLQT